MKQRIYQKGKEKGLSPLEMKHIELTMQRQIEEAREEAFVEAFEQAAILMCSFHDNVLITDFWPKTAERNLKKLHDGVWSLFDTFITGYVTIEDCASYNKEIGKQEVRGKTLKLTGEGKWEHLANIEERKTNVKEMLTAAADELEEKSGTPELIQKIRTFLQESSKDT